MTGGPLEVWAFATAHVGRRVGVYAELPSTNDFAATLPDGGAVVAHFQTAGRGQYGRRWVSRPGAALLLSVCVAPPPAARRPVALTAWAAVAVADAVEALTGAGVRLKWPNDLLVGGKKVCGILIEQAGPVVAGIGLNVTQTAAEFTDAGLPDATSLELVAGRAVALREAAGAVMEALDRWYGGLLAADSGPLEAAWRARLGLVGQVAVATLADGATVAGRVRGVAFNGLELDCGGLVPVAVPPERVRGVRVASGA